MNSFIYPNGDSWPYDLNDMDTTKILVLLILLERERPGTLAHVLRTCALIDGSYSITSTSSDPSSVKQQMDELASWLEVRLPPSGRQGR